jgi:hypothetical protein
MPNERKNLRNSMDLFWIAVFDIWIANEDRNANNYNLLMVEANEDFSIIPIDHEMELQVCFKVD